MKRHLLPLLVLSFSLITPALAQQPFVAHEWGTFTTLAGSDGVLLPGLYREEEPLPYFVQNLPGFSYGGYIHKGLYLECNNVTLKMETPVIYFYSDKAQPVSVKVNWPGGTISQFYPDRSSGEAANYYGTIDFASAHNGWIHWDANILAHSSNDTTGMWKEGETHTWAAPRATDANVVTGASGEVEKYLFYRGVGNAAFMDGNVDGHYVLNTSFVGNTLVVQNLTHYNIQYGLIFERTVNPSTGDSTNTVWWSGPIGDGAKIQCTAPSVSTQSTFDANLTSFRDKLVAAGLYKKEADAMIDTWKQSYFGTPGLRVLWIVPQSSTEKSLPLSITPKPDQLVRVLVARSEVLTPAFEQQLVQDFANGNEYNYANDRYFLAYQARVSALNNTSASVKPSTLIASDIRATPNPFSSSLLLSFHSSDAGAAQVAIVNLLGAEVARLFTGELEAGDHTYTWDAHDMSPGMYLCIIRANGSTQQMPVMLVR